MFATVSRRCGDDYESLEGEKLEFLLAAIEKEYEEKLFFAKDRRGFLCVGLKKGFDESWLLGGDLPSSAVM